MNTNLENKSTERSKKYCMSQKQRKLKYAEPEYAAEVPECCDLCQKSIPEMDFYADAVIPGSRQWGFMCQECIAERKLTFSPESGHLFQKQKNPEPNEEWLQVAGQTDEPKDCICHLYHVDGTMFGYINESGEIIDF